MRVRFAAFTLCAVLEIHAQVQNESNMAQKRFALLAKDAIAPMADILKAADEWMSTYERQGPGPATLPPYLDMARLYARKGVRIDQIPGLLEKGVNEISAPGSFTQSRSRSNSPFEDDIQRSLAANVYTQLKLYDKARELLSIAGRTVAETGPAVLDSEEGRRFSKRRIFEALRFSYWDGMTRLAIAEGRKDEALAFERLILTNRDNVAADRLIEEHRHMAQELWKELDRAGDFDQWLAGAGPK